MTRELWRAAGLAAMVAGCNVPEPRKSSGATLPDASAVVDGGVSCGRGAVVVEQPLEDYGSTNVALVDWTGTVLAPSIAASSTTSVGLTAPLSGDVVPPTAIVTGPEIVVIDRYRSASKIVWVDIHTAKRRELSVAPGGFYANPHDYLAISQTKAYVTRFGENPTPGAAPLDSGNDVLVVDPSAPKLVGSIPLTDALGADAARALPRPDRLVRSGDRAYVLLGALSQDFSTSVASRLVSIDITTDTVTSVLLLSSFRNCAGLALSPTGRELSVLCSGSIGQTTVSDLTGSGVAVVDVSSEPPRIVHEYPATSLGGRPVGFYGDYASDSTLLVQTFGYRTDVPTTTSDDAVFALDVVTGAASELLTSAGLAFTLGGIVCNAPCGACYVADAGRGGGVLHRYAVDGSGGLVERGLVKVETNPNFPPETLGRF